MENNDKTQIPDERCDHCRQELGTRWVPFSWGEKDRKIYDLVCESCYQAWLAQDIEAALMNQ